MTIKEADNVKLSGYMYEVLEGNHEKAIEEFRKLDECECEGGIHPFELIGLDYLYGNGLPLNHVAAEECLKKAIAHGDTAAIIFLGELYKQRGEFDKAFKQYQKALDMGDTDAGCNWASCTNTVWASRWITTRRWNITKRRRSKEAQLLGIALPICTTSATA